MRKPSPSTTTFLEKFPSHAGASVARVRVGLAQLRQSTSGGGHWEKALQDAQKVLKDIAPEKDFKEAHGELASMLPDIAEGLAEDASKKTSQELVDQSRKAMEMAVKYVPKSLRQVARLEEIERRLQITERAVARDNELAKTVAAMSQAAKESKTQEAYAACAALLRVYPALADNPDLEKAS